MRHRTSRAGLVAIVSLSPLPVLGSALAADPQPHAGQRQPSTLPSSTRPQAQGDLVIEDITIGKGAEITEGSWAVLHYEGTLLDGTPFETSRAPGGRP